MEEIIIEIKDGKATLKVRGVRGPACRALSKPIEDVLGEVIEDKPTEEYYARQTENARLKHS